MQSAATAGCGEGAGKAARPVAVCPPQRSSVSGRGWSWNAVPPGLPVPALSLPLARTGEGSEGGCQTCGSAGGRAEGRWVALGTCKERGEGDALLLMLVLFFFPPPL